MPLDDPQSRAPNEWYDCTPRYAGSATIAFEGEILIEGEGAFSFSESGEAQIDFECRDAAQSRRLDDILAGGQPGAILPGGPPRPTAITIASHGGTYVADYRVYLTGHTMTIGAQRNTTAKFRSIGGTFSADGAQQPACFALPLYNMLSPSFVTLPRAQPPEIAYHPLRIFPTPQTEYDPEDHQSFLSINWHNQLITFKIDAQIGFIEPLPDYRERAERLTTGDSKSLITAFLVCNAADRDCLANNPTTWFPIDLLNLLSLATGQRVGAPWVEYRDANGQLVRRVHRDFGCPSFNPGHALLHEMQEPNTGHLVTQGFQYSDLASTRTRLIITHLINAGLRRRSIDERLLSLFRAFEIVAVEQGVASTNLRASLQPATDAAVKARLDSCWNDLRTIAAGTTGTDSDLVNRMADKVRGADQKDRLFGEAVGNAATQLGFHDHAVLSGGWTTRGGNSWSQFLSRLRGDVVHQGGLDLMSGAYDVQEVGRISSHLLDLLLRIVARRLSSQAKYASAVFPVGLLRDIDWVNATTSATQLVPP